MAATNSDEFALKRKKQELSEYKAFYISKNLFSAILSLANEEICFQGVFRALLMWYANIATESSIL